MKAPTAVGCSEFCVYCCLGVLTNVFLRSGEEMLLEEDTLVMEDAPEADAVASFSMSSSVWPVSDISRNAD